MFGWLRRQRREAPRPDTPPPFALAEIPDALDRSDSIPRVNWPAVEAWAATRPADEDAHERWCELQRQWVDELAEALGDPYVWAESDELILWCARPGDEARDLLALADRAFRATCEIVGPPAEPLGKLVILCFGSNDEFYDYIAPLYPEGTYGGIGGVCVSDGDTHVALPDSPHGVESTLVHEMVHVCLGQDVPLWLQEGVAEIVPEHVSRQRRQPLNERDVRRHRHHWSKRGLDGFWAGRSFSEAGRGRDLSYELAYLLVSILAGDHRPRLPAFLRAAKRDDCGAAAAREHLGMSLGDLAAQFLGPGAWEPTSDPPDEPGASDEPAKPDEHAPRNDPAAKPGDAGELRLSWRHVSRRGARPGRIARRWSRRWD